jgi:hypothetical protein
MRCTCRSEILYSLPQAFQQTPADYARQQWQKTFEAATEKNRAALMLDSQGGSVPSQATASQAQDGENYYDDDEDDDDDDDDHDDDDDDEEDTGPKKVAKRTTSGKSKS